MKSKLIALLGLVTVGATGLALTSFALPKELEKQTANATIKSIDLDNSELSSVALVDYELFDGIVDKKFTITIDEEHYIDGLVLFNDKDGGSVGNTLGSLFTAAGNKEYDFNILLSIKGIDSLDFRFSYEKTYTAFDSEEIEYGFRRLGGSAAERYANMNYDLYAFAKEYNYEQLVEQTAGGPYTYSKISRGSTGSSGNYSIVNSSEVSGAYMVDLGFIGSLSENTTKVDFKITKLNVTYTC